MTRANCSADTENCGSQDFPNDILCEIDNIIAEVENIACETANFAVEAADFIGEQFEALLTFLEDLLPSTDDIIEFLEDALAAVDDFFDSSFAIPCPIDFGDEAGDFPENPLSIPTIGPFGDTGAVALCRLRWHFLPDAIKETVPGDTFSSGLLGLFGHIPDVLEYLCRCYEAASDIVFDDDQQLHRELVARRFCKDGVDDEDCESWSLVTGCSGFECDDNNDADDERDDRFLKVSDLARLGETADDCGSSEDAATLHCVQDTVDAISDQVSALQSDVDELNDDLDDLDGDVAVVDAKLQDSLEDADDTTETLEAFQDLALQLRIEADLIRDGDRRVSLFQLPEAVCADTDPETCGLIELVASTLSDAIDQRQAAGRDVANAVFYLERGDALYSEGAYKKAYTEYRTAYRELVLTRQQ